ncbi:MAG: DNA-processing protein DprA, partial [Pseudoalteromonas sp.]
MTQSTDKLTHWLAFYLCKGLGIKTLITLAQTYPLESLFSLSHQQLLECGLNQQIAANLLKTNWQQVEHYRQLIQN